MDPTQVWHLECEQYHHDVHVIQPTTQANLLAKKVSQETSSRLTDKVKEGLAAATSSKQSSQSGATWGKTANCAKPHRELSWKRRGSHASHRLDTGERVRQQRGCSAHAWSLARPEESLSPQLGGASDTLFPCRELWV